MGGPHALCQPSHLQLLTIVDNLCAGGSNWYNSTHIVNVLTSTCKVMYGGTRMDTNFKQHIYYVIALYTGTYAHILDTTIAL